MLCGHKVKKEPRIRSLSYILRSKSLASSLGISSETQLIHSALSMEPLQLSLPKGRYADKRKNSPPLTISRK